jgi:hypothetical protein
MEIFVAPSRSNRSGRYYHQWAVGVNDSSLGGPTLVSRYAHKSNAVRAARALPGQILRPEIQNQDNRAVAVVNTPRNRITLGNYGKTSDARKRLVRFFQRLESVDGFAVLNTAIV